MNAQPTKEQKVIRTDEAMDRLAELVTKHGPKFLVRGMPAYQAHEAMVACIEHLVASLKEIALHGTTRPMEMCPGDDGDGHWQRIATSCIRHAARALEPRP